MRVLVTGATGFVGRWLIDELAGAGHDAIGAPSSAKLDIADASGVAAMVRDVAPNVIAHLASTPSRQDAERDPERAVVTTIGGTCAVTRAAASLARPAGVLVVSSAEVYGPFGLGVIDESHPTQPATSYGMIKLAMEAIATVEAARTGLPLVIVRPFNHVGPGQRQPSAAASFAQRVAAVRSGAANEVVVGNLDVERDIADVRDVVSAYRLLLEALADGRVGRPARILNVGSGQARPLREVLATLCRLAGVAPAIRVDDALLRPHDPPRVVADVSAIARLTGWQPRIPLEKTLADILAERNGDG